MAEEEELEERGGDACRLLNLFPSPQLFSPLLILLILPPVGGVQGTGSSFHCMD